MFTDADVRASEMFADANAKLRTIRKLYRKAPHLATKLKYSVRDARPEDYFIPDRIRGACKVVDVAMTEDLCRALSCNPTTEHGVCAPDTPASYYHVGDDGHDVQCQPACFNTTVGPTYDRDGGAARAPDTPMLNWHAGKCRVVPAAIVAYLEKTFFRSDTVYEYRKNDMPTGFSRKPSDNAYGCGLDYRTNAAYCRYYDRTLQEDGSCDLRWWEKGLDAVVGMSLVNTVKSNVRVLRNGAAPFDPPADLPPLPAELDVRYTVDGWKGDVNENFRVPELIDVKELHHHHGGGGGGGGKRVKRSTEQRGGDSAVWVERARDVMLGMLEQAFTDTTFWTQLGAGVVTQAALDSLKSRCKRAVERLSLSLVKRLPTTVVTSSIGANVLRVGLRSACKKAVTAAVMRTASKAALAAAKIASAAVSVVGWLLLVATLLDVLFTFWDPYGYNNMFPPTLPHDLMVNGERAFRQAAERATLDYEFDEFAALVLTEEELLDVQVESLRERVAYLDALDVNSDGARIDRGETIRFDGAHATMIEEAHRRAMVERLRFEPSSYDDYNRTFLARVRDNGYANVGAAVCAVAAVGSAALGMRALCALFALVAFVALAFARLHLVYGVVGDYDDTRVLTPPL